MVTTSFPEQIGSLLVAGLVAAGTIAGPAAVTGVHTATNATSTSTATTSAATTSATTLIGDETGLISAINQARGANGVAALTPEHELTILARQRSDDQVSRNYFSHTTPGGHNIFDLLNAANVQWSLAGENLAESRGMDPVQAAITGFLNSPPHRANVLDPHFTHIGVGAAQKSDGTTILSVVFTD